MLVVVKKAWLRENSELGVTPRLRGLKRSTSRAGESLKKAGYPVPKVPY